MNRMMAVVLVAFLPATAALASEISYIESPSPCAKATSIESQRVYFEDAGQCGDLRGLMKLDTPNPEGYDVYVNGDFWEHQNPKIFHLGMEEQDLSSFPNREALSRSPDNIDKNASDLARSTYEILSSKPYADLIESENRRLGRFFGVPDDVVTGDGDSANLTLLPADERIYIFISSSVPVPVLRAYAKALDQLRDKNIFFVLRGFVGDVSQILPTRKLIDDITLVDRECESQSSGCPRYAAEFQIDPLLFSRYEVTAVPTFVYAQGVDTSGAFENSGNSEGIPDRVPVGRHFGISGDLMLDAALEEVGKDSNSEVLCLIIALLRNVFYHTNNLP